MRCQTCGEELREGARFCPTCGTPTQPGEAQTPPTVQIRRTPPQPGGQSPEATVVVPPAAVEQDQEPSAAEPPPEPAPRPGRDPGAGYDPVGPPRPAASQSGARRPAGASSTARPAGGLSLTAPSSADFNTLVQRLLRLARLDTSVFGELYADASATIPVAIFAAIVLVISGLGGMLFINSLVGFDFYRLGDGHGAGEFFLLSVILGTILGLIALGLWGSITMGLLKQFGGVDADILGLARVFGVAIVPLVLSLLLFIDSWFFGLSWITMGAVGSLAIIGVLEAVDVRPGPAWLATLVGFAAFVVLLTLLGGSTRDLAPGFFVGG